LFWVGWFWFGLDWVHIRCCGNGGLGFRPDGGSLLEEPPVSAYLSSLLIDSIIQGGEGTWQCQSVMTTISKIGRFNK
jgi:hypothetical protein